MKATTPIAPTVSGNRPNAAPGPDRDGKNLAATMMPNNIEERAIFHEGLKRTARSECAPGGYGFSLLREVGRFLPESPWAP
jgi:hypothetical protein